LSKIQKRQLEERAAGCKMEAQCKDGVRADGLASLIVATGERCGLLGVGFENIMRSWVAQQGLSVVASRWLSRGGGKAKAQGRGIR